MTETPFAAPAVRDWRHHAVRRDEDPELFFPISPLGSGAAQIEQAKAVCRCCPVVTDCLTWALDHGVTDGVWGGMSEDERKALRRRRHSTDPALLAVRSHQATTPGLDRIRDLAARGYTDRQIAEQLGEDWTKDAVFQLRAQHNIKAGWHARQSPQAAAEALGGAA